MFGPDGVFDPDRRTIDPEKLNINKDVYNTIQRNIESFKIAFEVTLAEKVCDDLHEYIKMKGIPSKWFAPTLSPSLYHYSFAYTTGTSVLDAETYAFGAWDFNIITWTDIHRDEMKRRASYTSRKSSFVCGVIGAVLIVLLGVIVLTLTGGLLHDAFPNIALFSVFPFPLQWEPSTDVGAIVMLLIGFPELALSKLARCFVTILMFWMSEIAARAVIAGVILLGALIITLIVSENSKKKHYNPLALTYALLLCFFCTTGSYLFHISQVEGSNLFLKNSYSIDHLTTHIPLLLVATLLFICGVVRLIKNIHIEAQKKREAEKRYQDYLFFVEWTNAWQSWWDKQPDSIIWNSPKMREERNKLTNKLKYQNSNFDFNHDD